MNAIFKSLKLLATRYQTRVKALAGGLCPTLLRSKKKARFRQLNQAARKAAPMQGRSDVYSMIQVPFGFQTVIREIGRLTS